MKFNTIRAWKDESYRQSLSAAERGLSPVGELDLSDADLQAVYGGSEMPKIDSLIVCTDAPITAPVQTAVTSAVILGAIFGDCVGDNKNEPKVHA